MWWCWLERDFSIRGKFNMNSVLLAVILGLTYLPYQTSSAPAAIPSQNNGNYVAELLNYVQLNKCPFPVPQEFGNGTEVYSRLNGACRDTRGVKLFDRETNASLTASNFMCVAVADFVVKICDQAKQVPDLVMKKEGMMNVNSALENSATVAELCEELRKIEPKTEDLNPELVKLFKVFISKDTKDTDAQKCESLCQGKVAGIMESISRNKLNPTCVLLKKELEILEVLRKPDVAVDEEKPQPSREGVSNLKSLEAKPESPNDELSKVNPISPSITGNDKIGSEPAKKISPSSSVKVPSNISPLPSSSALDPEVQGDDPRHPQETDIVQKSEDSEKKDSKQEAGKGSPVPNKDPGSSSKPSSTSTASSVDINRVNPAEDEVEPPPPVSAKPSVLQEGKQPAQEQKPPTEDKSKISDSNKASSSPVSQGISSSTKSSDVVPEQKPVKDDEVNEDGDGSQKAPPPFDAEDDNFDGLEVGNEDENLINEKGDKVSSGSVPRQDKKQESPNKFSEGVGSIPLESPNSPISFDEVDSSGGYFNYFIFFLTIMALCFFAFHNKRRILAFVVEGRRPRGAGTGRSRRRSSGSSGASYRRLEQNFE